jgi:8-oxo-dGTP diphosphatase
MRSAGNFVIRVYGIFLNDKNEVLLTDELRFGIKMTKFPGGGLDYGEGPVDCLRREIREECNGQEIEHIEHYYTTGHFQEALFYKDHQLISIYYRASLKPPLLFSVSEKPFDFTEDKEGNQSFRWQKLSEAKPEMLSFPIDKLVLAKLTGQ